MTNTERCAVAGLWMFTLPVAAAGLFTVCGGASRGMFRVAFLASACAAAAAVALNDRFGTRAFGSARFLNGRQRDRLAASAGWDAAIPGMRAFLASWYLLWCLAAFSIGCLFGTLFSMRGP